MAEQGKDHWHSGNYQHSASFVPKLAGKVTQWLNLQKDDVVLDIGCGDGILNLEFAKVLSQGKGSIHGIDSSAAMIEAAKELCKEHPSATFEVLDGNKMHSSAALQQGTFTKVFSNAAMHWILREEATRQPFFRAVHAALAPGGTFAFEMGGLGNVKEMAAALLVACARRAPGGMPAVVARHYPWFFPDEAWATAALEGAGFRVDRVEREWRPTAADKGGVEGWIRLMGSMILESVPEGAEREDAIREAVEALRVTPRRPRLIDAVDPASMMDQDQEIRSYVHLVQLPRADDALRMLRLVASAVKPIMRKHRWRVGELSEFYPDEETLMGLNYNRGQRICLRLRFFGNSTLFMGLDRVMDTMLHELCHNVHGPHNDAFHALWETLRDEHLTLSLSGYSGASFLSEGRRLGGSASAVPARERGRVLSRGGGGGVVAVAGRRLGGGTRPALPPTPEMLRAAAAEAAERRKRALEGCGANTLDQTQIRDIGETVRRNGFKTQAEEDKANDVAIAQALAELMGEDRAPSRQRTPPASSSSGSANRNAPAVRSRLFAMMEQQGSLRRRNENASASSGSSGGSAGWVCSVCTLHNPGGYLCCDACQSQRKDIPVIDLT